MARQKGLLITCNRCQTAVFCAFEGMVPQEWSQPKESYKAAPEGWERADALGKPIDLCPRCSKLWTEIQEEFMAPPPKEAQP